MSVSAPWALVVGAGVAGIQAALDLADAGTMVYLLERGDSIGGRMAQTDKTFPTLDCSSCTLTPRTVEVEAHPNVHLITRAELTGLTRRGSTFEAEISVRPRFVDMERCVSCGRCSEACRLAGKVVSEFDLGLGRVSAIGVPFPQAVPSTYAVDPAHCLMLRFGKCGKGPKCVEACDVDAISFEEEERVLRVEVGAVILATGYDLYDPADTAVGRPELGYRELPRVITNLEFERLSSASGPTQGKILVEGREPKRIIFIQCIGSRDRTTGAAYCSRVCCMVSLKQAVLSLEKIESVEATILYMDIRAFGKGYEEFMERAQRLGATLRRGAPSEIFEREEEVIVRVEDTLLGATEELMADLVVLAAGLRPGKGSEELALTVGISTEEDGFFKTPKRDPAGGLGDGIFIAGACGGPVDIPDAVASGSAAAGAALEFILGGDAE
ncbi:MAG: hypothetical protein C0609_01805 [Deltaproteobacteria bacterium]|nr:MAG: hypothetical protein C0609_01805 [Deltaproteobacteria bacterium]